MVDEISNAEVCALLLDAWEHREPHVHGLELFVSDSSPGHFRVDLRIDVIEHHLPIAHQHVCTSCGTNVGERTELERAPEEQRRCSACGGVAPPVKVHRVSRFLKCPEGGALAEQLHEQHSFRVGNNVLHAGSLLMPSRTKHLYFHGSKGAEHVRWLVEKATPLLIHEAMNKAHEPEVEAAHREIDDNDIPRTVADWRRVMARAA